MSIFNPTPRIATILGQFIKLRAKLLNVIDHHSEQIVTKQGEIAGHSLEVDAATKALKAVEAFV